MEREFVVDIFSIKILCEYRILYCNVILVKCRARFNQISDAEKITTSKEQECMQGSPGKTFVFRSGNGNGNG